MQVISDVQCLQYFKVHALWNRPIKAEGSHFTWEDLVDNQLASQSKMAARIIWIYLTSWWISRHDAGVIVLVTFLVTLSGLHGVSGKLGMEPSYKMGKYSPNHLLE